MQLFQSWKDSLKFFIPANFKIFGLLTLNTSIKAYLVWLQYFWPIFVVSILADVFHIVSFHVGPFYTSIGALIGLFAKFLLLMTLYLSLRPSVKRKTPAYFSDYKTHTILLGLLFFIKAFLFQIIFRTGPFGADLFVLLMVFPFSIVAMTLFMLFYLDSRGGVLDLFWSWWRSLKMCIFGLPFCVVVSAIGYLVYFFAASTLLVLVNILPSIFSEKAVLLLSSIMKHAVILLSVPVIAMVANFYTKRLHDQFSLYFRS